MAGADPEKVSNRALERGKDQLGTLGSGNHFLEIEVVEVPARLSHAQREKLDEFAALASEDSYPQLKSFLERARRFFGGR